MDDQAPPLAGVAPEPVIVTDALQPSPTPTLTLTSEAEDALPSCADGRAPPPDRVAHEPATVTDALQPSPTQVLTSEAEYALPTGMDGLTSLLDGVAPEPLTVSEELPPPLLELEGALPNTILAASSVATNDGTVGVVLTDELRDQIVKQVEYYFSDENLPTDEFLLKYVNNNKRGFVPIETIASFRRMKKLVQDHSIIEAALRTSSKLVVSSNGKRIRRLHPLPHNEMNDSKKSTVVVENLPPNFSMESIQEKFGTVGKIVNVTINDPQLIKESATAKKADFIISSKVHALVEYEAVEAAEKAVATLNDVSNWRTGMKVKLLAKQSVTGSGKHNKSSKENQDTVSKKNNQNQPLKEEQIITSEKNSGGDSLGGAKDKENLKSVLIAEAAHQHPKPNAKGRRKGRYGGQGQIQHNTNRQGSSGSESLNRPIPGPRMPDGTRGFTMGRGRSLPLQKSDKSEE